MNLAAHHGAPHSPSFAGVSPGRQRDPQVLGALRGFVPLVLRVMEVGGGGGGAELRDPGSLLALSQHLDASPDAPAGGGGAWPSLSRDPQVSKPHVPSLFLPPPYHWANFIFFFFFFLVGNQFLQHQSFFLN